MGSGLVGKAGDDLERNKLRYARNNSMHFGLRLCQENSRAIRPLADIRLIYYLLLAKEARVA